MTSSSQDDGAEIFRPDRSLGDNVSLCSWPISKPCCKSGLPSVVPRSLEAETVEGHKPCILEVGLPCIWVTTTLLVSTALHSGLVIFGKLKDISSGGVRGVFLKLAISWSLTVNPWNCDVPEWLHPHSPVAADADVCGFEASRNGDCSFMELRVGSSIRNKGLEEAVDRDDFGLKEVAVGTEDARFISGRENRNNRISPSSASTDSEVARNSFSEADLTVGKTVARLLPPISCTPSSLEYGTNIADIRVQTQWLPLRKRPTTCSAATRVRL